MIGDQGWLAAIDLCSSSDRRQTADFTSTHLTLSLLTTKMYKTIQCNSWREKKFRIVSVYNYTDS